MFYCAVVVVATAGPLVIVTVVCGEHHGVVVAEGIFTGVTRVPGHAKGVVALFRQNSELTILSVVHKNKPRPLQPIFTATP